MEKPTQHETILKYLRYAKGWVPGYLLSKGKLMDVWIGSRGERSARDLVSPNCPADLRGQTERGLGKELKEQGFTVDAFGRPIQNKYVYYRAAQWNGLAQVANLFSN